MRKMNYLLVLAYILLFAAKVNAQTNVSDEKRVFIYAIAPEGEGIPPEACRRLETKLQQVLTTNGIADKGYCERFVLTAKIDIVSKDIVPSTPPRVSEKMEIMFMVGDVVENKLYETCTIELAGIGTNETKSFIAAFSKINPQQNELQEMLARAKEQIVDYYTSHCDEIISHVAALEGMQQYDEAIFQLLSVPNVCADCYRRCQEAVPQVYIQKINYEGAAFLHQAKTAWTTHPDQIGASQAASYISQINSQSSVYKEVETLQKEIENKLQADEKEAWKLQKQQLENEQKFKQSIVDACKAIGVAWGNGQPKSVAKTIIRGWW